MDQYLYLAWALASLGLAIGILLHKMPSSEMKSWGDQFIGYSILTAGFLAVVGSGQILTNLALNISKSFGLPIWIQPEKLPSFYYDIGQSSYLALITITGLGMASALVPIVGPALANMFSVASTLPSLALTGTTMLSFMLASMLVIFVTLAPLVVPIGIVLIAVAGGKLKGLGGWLIAMSMALNAVGPIIPSIGMMSCTMEGEVNCNLETLKNLPLSSVMDIINWFTSPEGSVVMGAWRFMIGSFAAFTIMSLVMIALSKAIGGIASSLGIG